MTSLVGTGALVRLVVRRDRVRLLAWVAAIVALVAVTAASTKGLYPTQRDLDLAAAAVRDNPAALAFNGPDQALDTIGGQIAYQVGAFGLVVVGLMSLLLVGRLTRTEEDSGRLELVRSMPVGRDAPLAAALVVVGGAQLLTAAGASASLVALDQEVHGSVVFGLGFLGVGWVWMGLTALTAQVAENPRVATGVAGGALGVAYVVRAAGDMSGGGLSWLSPIGWAQKARPFAGETWWPLVLLLAVAAALVAAAVVVAERRDFGAGLVPPRPGPARAAPGLRSPLALAVRLHRTAIAWWALATALLGLVYGSLAESIEDFIGDNEAIADILASLEGVSLVDSYLSTSLLITALLAVGPALQVAGRMRAEEADLRVEPLLATQLSRPRWMGAHVALALGGAALALALGGLGLGVGHAAVGGGTGQVAELTVGALVYLPAVLLLAGLPVLLFGVAPRWTVGGWLGLAVAFVIAMFGELLELPQLVMDVSPMQHVPPVPASGVRVPPLAVLAALAATTIAAGFVAFRRRDLRPG